MAAQDTVLFVSGNQRSGTTLLQLILNSHPDIAIIPETSELARILSLNSPNQQIIAESLQQLKDFITSDQKLAKWQIDLDEYYQLVDNYQTVQLEQVVLDLFHYFRRKTKPAAHIIGAKKGYFVKNWQSIKELFPQAKFLMIIRDSRAVVESMVRTWPRYDIMTAALSWRQRMDRGEQLQRTYPADCLQILYEDLIANPAEQCQKICQFLSIDYQPAMITDYIHNETARKKGDKKKHPHTYEPITEGRKDIWRQKLSPKSIYQIEKLTGEYLVQYGYKSQSLPHVQIISYPKCGRTWLRIMLGQMLCNQFHVDESYLEVETISAQIEAIPLIQFSHDDNSNTRNADYLRQLTKVHQQKYQNKQVVLLYRDIRDIIVSYYFEVTRKNNSWRPKRGTFAQDISEFLRHPVGSVDTIIAFYNLWAQTRHHLSDFTLLRYEELMQDTHRALQRVLAFLGIEIDSELVDKAIEDNQFAKMHKMEQENHFSSRRLQSTNPDDPEAYKTRKGKVGGYVDYLSRQDIDYLNEKLIDLDPFYSTS